MIKGLGNDIIAVSRIRASIGRHGKSFLDKVFTETEQAYCLRYKDAAPHFAGRFAAKEAIVKALGTGFRNGITWLDIEIMNDDAGKPCVSLSDTILLQFNEPNVLISISHCREYATAVAVYS